MNYSTDTNHWWVKVLLSRSCLRFWSTCHFPDIGGLVATGQPWRNQPHIPYGLVGHGYLSTSTWRKTPRNMFQVRCWMPSLLRWFSICLLTRTWFANWLSFLFGAQFVILVFFGSTSSSHGWTIGSGPNYFIQHLLSKHTGEGGARHYNSESAWRRSRLARHAPFGTS